MSAPLALTNHSDLLMLEATIERGLGTFVEVGTALAAIRDGHLYRATHKTFEQYCRDRWDFERAHVHRLIQGAGVVGNLSPIGDKLPTTESQARPLAALPPAQQTTAWQQVVETAPNGRITTAHVESVVAQIKASELPVQPAAPRAAVTLAEWQALSRDERRALIDDAPHDGATGLNQQHTDRIEWAQWSWNPITGCLHDCPYCYARDIAERFYPQKFVPAIVPARLHAPRNVRIPERAATEVGFRNIFTCSMADLFGKWVPQAWIDAVFAETLACPQWNFLFLTKFPQRLAEQCWPDNAWVGTTVDRQARVSTAERSFAGVQAGIKWLSCEPLLERLTFTSLDMFDWVVIGGSSQSSQTAEFQPPWEWVEHLISQARTAGCRVYLKPNLTSRPKEYPGS